MFLQKPFFVSITKKTGIDGPDQDSERIRNRGRMVKSMDPKVVSKLLSAMLVSLFALTTLFNLVIPMVFGLFERRP